MVKAKTTYKADDGQTFDSKEEAERHDEIARLKRAYETARDEFGLAVLRGQKTADGKLFKIAPGPDYYLLLKPWYSPPRIVSVHFYWTHWDWFLGDNEELKLRVKVSVAGRGEETMDIGVSDLYAKRENAIDAFLVANQKAINQRQKDHDELAANRNQIQIAW